MSSDFAAFELTQRISVLLIAIGYVIASVVIATAVRRRRPDAWRGLLAWAIAGCAVTLVDLFVGYVVSHTRGDEAVGNVIRTMTVYFVVFGLAHVGLLAFLARGLVRLAQPAEPEPAAPASETG